MLWPAWKLSACQEEFCCLDLAAWLFYVAVKCGAHCMNEKALVTNSAAGPREYWDSAEFCMVICLTSDMAIK